MKWHPGGIDRRHHHRIPTAGQVVLHAQRGDIHGQLRVLGVNDLEVECDLGFGLLSMAGAAVEVELSLEGTGLRFVPLRGRVTHVRAESHSLVVRISEIPRELAAVIEASLAHPELGANEAVIET